LAQFSVEIIVIFSALKIYATGEVLFPAQAFTLSFVGHFSLQQLIGCINLI
jgi:hypothetical protein